jgi:photosynthetic reaction center cytochrome c subunit
MSRRVMILGAATALACCAFVGDGVRAQSAQSAAPATEKKAEEQFKNIQTLKGIPADQLIPTMQFIAASLGVECEFCHVQNAFDKDDKKPKQTARKMMEMMFAINKNNFNGQRAVTCYSCHRGNTDPVAIPAVMTEAEAMSGPKKPEGEEKHAENSGPSGDQLIDKFVQASGGAAAIGKVTSRVMKGKIEVGAMSLPIDIYTKDPDKRVSFTHMQDGDNITAFDGHGGWMGAPNRPVREMHGGDIDGASIDADLQLPIHLKDMFTDLKVRGTEKIGDHDAYVAVGQRADKPPIRLYFDEQSGLLVRMLRFGETALGRMPTEIDYADYRDASGVKIPYEWTLARPSGRFTIQISEVQTNVPVDDAKFAKPPAPAGPPKGPAQ